VYWPESQDFNEVVQNPSICFSDPDLVGGAVAVNQLGLPVPHSGSFADVYQLKSADGKSWAVKCFTRRVSGLAERYRLLDEHLKRSRLPFMIAFQFLEQGIRLRGQWFPIVKMEWVDGVSLNEFVRTSADKPAILQALLQIWVKMARGLREASIAHGDLQHGNVLLIPGSTPGSLAVRLIDYDGIWVPSMGQLASNEAGHPAYQHPLRTRMTTGSSDLDRYPHLVIACALRSLIVGGSALWKEFDDGDNLLFRRTDLSFPGASALVKRIVELGDRSASILASQIALVGSDPLDQTPWIDELIPEGVEVIASQRLDAATQLLIQQIRPAGPAPVDRPPQVAASSPVHDPGPSIENNREAGPDWERVTDEEDNPTPTRSRWRRTIILASVLLLAFVGLPIALLLKSKAPPPRVNKADSLSAATEIAGTGKGKMPQPAAPAVAIDERAGHFETRAPVEFEIAPGVKMKFCWVPPGKATLGSPKEEKGRSLGGEEELEYTSKGFWLGKYPVTQEQWQAMMGKNPSRFVPTDPAIETQGIKDTSRFPVEDVSWNDCQEFIHKLNKGPRSPALGNGVFCVPHEYEWEYAARGGRGNKQPFYFGKELNGTQANCNGLRPYGTTVEGPYLARTTAVGSYEKIAPHPWGLCDMHGNVWQWCENDWRRDPSIRAQCGGSWGDNAMDLRASYRAAGKPSRADGGNQGLRVCFRPNVVPPEPTKPPPTAEKPNPLAELNGNWIVVRVESRGEALPDEMLRDPKAPDQRSTVLFEFVFTECAARFKLGEEKPRTLKVKIDATQNPKQIDLISEAGQVEKGIYHVAQGLLSICVSSKDEERPGQFVTDAKNNHLLLVLKKDGAQPAPAVPVSPPAVEKPQPQPNEKPLEVPQPERLGSTIEFLNSPNRAFDRAKEDERLVLALFASGEFENAKFTSADAQNLRAGALADPAVGEFLKQHFVGLYQKIGPSGNEFKMARGNVVACVCGPDGSVLNAIAGPVDAQSFLREVRWSVDTIAAANKAAGDDHSKIALHFKKAHIDRYFEAARAADSQPPPAALPLNRPAGVPIRAQIDWLLGSRAAPSLSDVVKPIYQDILGEKDYVPPGPDPARVLEVVIAGGVKMTFCLAPAGKTMLGSPATELERSLDEQEHEFITKGFWIGKYPVTQGEWSAVMGPNSNPSEFTRANRFVSRVGIVDTERFPVDNVSWKMCQKFVTKLGQSAKLPPEVAKGTICLPTEDEWEYAARGGRGNKRPFYFGGNLNGTLANCDGNFPYTSKTKGPSLQRTTAVGSYEELAPHPWGLCDVVGNVWQWCDNIYDGKNYAARGGSFYTGPKFCRHASRHSNEPDYADSTYGLRICIRPAGALPTVENSQPQQKPLAGLRGKWFVVRAELKGNPVPEELFRDPKAPDFRSTVTFEDNMATIKLGPEKPRIVKVKIDPAKKPKQIDFIDDDNAAEFGIYNLDAGLLSLCFSGKGEQQRPGQFATDAKNNNWLMVLKKN